MKRIYDKVNGVYRAAERKLFGRNKTYDKEITAQDLEGLLGRIEMTTEIDLKVTMFEKQVHFTAYPYNILNFLKQEFYTPSYFGAEERGEDPFNFGLDIRHRVYSGDHDHLHSINMNSHVINRVGGWEWKGIIFRHAKLRYSLPKNSVPLEKTSAVAPLQMAENYSY